MSRLNRFLVCVTAGAMMSVASTTGAAVIAIPNASFEGGVNNATDLDPEGWGVGGVDNNASSVNPGTRVSTDFAHEGLQSLRMDAVNSPQNREIFSPIYSASGDSTTPVVFKFWAYTPTSTPISNTQLVGVIEFKKLFVDGDPSSGDFFVPDLGLTVVPTNDPANAPDAVLTPGEWKQYSVTQTATGPWDLVIFHIKIEGLSGGGNSGAIYFDDVTATVGVVPEPTTLAGLAAAGGLLLRRRRV